MPKSAFPVFDFPANKENVLRHTQVIAPPQLVRGKRVQVVVTAGALVKIPEPPESKGIRNPLAVIEIVVRPVTSDETILYDFDPPLQITIEVGGTAVLRKQSAQPAPIKRARGEQPSGMFTCYRDKYEKWHWQKLATETTTLDKQPALTAKIKTLHPEDPEGIF